MTSTGRWYDRLDEFGLRTALIDSRDQAINYRDLAARADAFAASLGSAALVAVEAERDIATIVAYLACLRRGTPVLMLEGGPKSDALLATFAPDVVVRSGVVVPGAGDARPAHPDLRLLLSTSGSTGSPKLVRLSATNLDSNARSIVDYLGIRADDVAITTLPLFYSYGISVLNSHLAAGAALVVADDAVTSDAFLAAVERHRVTSIAGVPATYDLLLSSGMLDRLPASARSFTQAGGKMGAVQVTSLADRLGRRGATLWVMYGQTEASPRMAYLPPDKIAAHPDCIGRAIPGGTLTVEQDGEPVAPGGIGELVYRGPNVMMGYALGRDDLARGPELAALKTGDLGREIAPGLFRIEGRISRFIKPLGLRIGLDELETLGGAGIRVAGSDTRGAVVVATRPTDLAAARAAHAPLGLPPSLVTYQLLDAIPTLGSGKVDYAGILLATAATDEASDGAVAIEACFARAARGRPVTDDMTFARIGGDSLTFVEAAIVVDTAIGEPRQDWASLTLGQLKALAASRVGMSVTVPPRGLPADTAVRALAILLVALCHAVGTFEGGADVMMVLAGLGWARFQRAKIDETGLVSTLWATLARLMAIYFGIVLLYSLLKHKLYLSHLLLYSTFIGDWGGALNIYWFIASLFWCTVAAGVIYAVAGPERVRRNTLAFTLALFAIAVVIRFGGQMLFDAPANRMRSPDQMLVYFVGGALIGDARTWGRVVVAAVLAGLSGLAWGFVSSHAIIMVVCCGLLIGRAWLPIPSAVHGPIRLIARNSFYIYIMFIVPMYLTDQILKEEHGRYWLLHIAVALGAGIGLGTVADWLGEVVRTRSIFGRELTAWARPKAQAGA